MTDFYSLPAAVQIAVITSIVSAAVTVAMGFWTYATQMELEKLKGTIAQATSLSNARQAYEFDARKRLYAQIEPLLFQLAEAAEGSYNRIVSLVRTQLMGKLGRAQPSWLMPGPGSLNRPDYYLTSTLYRVFLPLAIYRLVQRSATFFDLTLDPEIHKKYFLLKASFVCFTDDFKLAGIKPSLRYEPNRSDWRTIREENPSVHWRQGLVAGHLEQLSDAMIIERNDEQRPMTFGEFEKAALEDEAFQKTLSPPIDLFMGFSFDERPIFARILLAQACLMRTLLKKAAQLPPFEELLSEVVDFTRSEAAQTELHWGCDQDQESWAPVRSYLTERLRSVFPENSLPSDSYNSLNKPANGSVGGGSDQSIAF